LPGWGTTRNPDTFPFPAQFNAAATQIYRTIGGATFVIYRAASMARTGIEKQQDFSSNGLCNAAAVAFVPLVVLAGDLPWTATSTSHNLARQ